MVASTRPLRRAVARVLTSPPVLSFAESRRHPHVAARAGTIEVGGIAQPAPAPRFDRTPSSAPSPPPERGSGGADALQQWGFDAAAIDALRNLGVRCT